LIFAGYMPSELAATTAPYIPSSLYLCPSATKREQETLNIGAFYTQFAGEPGLWPTTDGTIRMWLGDGGSYALHKAIWQAFQVNGDFYKTELMNGETVYLPLHESNLGSNPGERMFWAEFRHDNPRTWSPSPNWTKFNGTYNERFGFRNPHLGGGNFAAYDGHVGFFDRSQYYRAIASTDKTESEAILGFRW
jgi:prepilin-type processing-associated H-X9-DG protein